MCATLSFFAGEGESALSNESTSMALNDPGKREVNLSAAM